MVKGSRLCAFASTRVGTPPRVQLDSRQPSSPGVHAADRARGRSHAQSRSCATRRRGAASGEGLAIGFLSPYSADLDKNWRAAFQQGLRDLGYVEGKNIVIEHRYADGSLDRLSRLASDVFQLNVDVVVAHGGGGVVAMQVATKVKSTTPIVFIANPDPVSAGLVTSLARPGGRVTGISDQHSELVAKRLELLKETVPSLSRVAVLHLENPQSLTQLRDTKAAASVLRLTVVPVRTTGPGPKGIDDVFATIRRERAEALSGALFFASRGRQSVWVLDQRPLPDRPRPFE